MKRDEARRLALDAFELPESPSRRGHGPQGRGLAPTDQLAFAAMELLYRDDESVIRVERLAAGRPTCLGLAADRPARLLIEHVSAGDHVTGACRDWLAELVRLSRDLGCPSLEAMRLQIEVAILGLRPGRLRATRVRAIEGIAGDRAQRPRRPRGTFNRPARDLLARRAHAVGGLAALRDRISALRRARGLEPVSPTRGTERPPCRRRGWTGLVLEFDRETDRWEAGRRPDRRDITYPTWREWWRSPGRREGRGRDWVRLEDSTRVTAEDLGRSLRRRAAKIERLLDETLPELS